MPGASPEEQEEAYENLRGLTRVLAETEDRLEREHRERQRMLQPPLL